MQLSPHFTLTELTTSMTARRMGWPNEPTITDIQSLKYVAQHILEPVRRKFNCPFSPLSGYRSARLNRYIGGSLYSQHCKGQAVDFVLPGIANDVAAQWIVQHLDFDQLILEYSDAPGGWIHCSYVAEGNRRQALCYDGVTYKPWTPVLAPKQQALL